MAEPTPAQSAARFIIILAAVFLPTVSLLPLGGLYLYDKGLLLPWALGSLAVAGVVAIIERRLVGGTSQAAQISESRNEAMEAGKLLDDDLEVAAWADVKAIGRSAQIDRLDSMQAVFALAHTTVNAVATRFHASRADALWQFTMPEALAVTEQVSRELARFVHRNVPFGDKITVSQFIQIYGWRRFVDVAERAYDVWRILRIANPATALTNEARERLTRAFVVWGREKVTRRIVEEFVEQVGKAAIDLYSGRLKGEGLAEALPREDGSGEGLAFDQPPASSAGSAAAKKPKGRVLARRARSVAGALRRLSTALVRRENNTRND